MPVRTHVNRRVKEANPSLSPNTPYAHSEPERSEEPPVLATGVPLFQRLLDVLLRVLALGNLLECVVADDALEAFELEGVTGGHEVVVVCDFDKRLDL